MPDLAMPRGCGPLLSLSTVAALSAAFAAPFWSGHMQWVPRLVDGMVAATAVLLAFLLAAMVRLAVLDWLAQRRSRRAWDRIGGARAEDPEPTGCRSAQSDHPYAPVAANPTICAVLRARRHAEPGLDLNAGGTDTEANPRRATFSAT
jgi:hypothetical protein